MRVTCDTVRLAFGDFKCCASCHEESDELMSPLNDEPYSLCCGSQEMLKKHGVDYYALEITHPALLKALENQ